MSAPSAGDPRQSSPPDHSPSATPPQGPEKRGGRWRSPGTQLAGGEGAVPALSSTTSASFVALGKEVSPSPRDMGVMKVRTSEGAVEVRCDDA